MLEALGLIGFDLSEFTNKKVVLKPNLLTACPPEKGVVTHPVFFQAASRIVKENGGFPILAESPATKPLEKVLTSVGYGEILEQEGGTGRRRKTNPCVNGGCTTKIQTV